MPTPAPAPEGMVSVLATLNLNNPGLQAPLTAQQTATLVAAVQEVLQGVPGVQNVSLANAQVGFRFGGSGGSQRWALGFNSQRLRVCWAVTTRGPAPGLAVQHHGPHGHLQARAWVLRMTVPAEHFWGSPSPSSQPDTCDSNRRPAAAGAGGSG